MNLEGKGTKEKDMETVDSRIQEGPPKQGGWKFPPPPKQRIVQEVED